jgi:hypothetical protein
LSLVEQVFPVLWVLNLDNHTKGIFNARTLAKLLCNLFAQCIPQLTLPQMLGIMLRTEIASSTDGKCLPSILIVFMTATGRALEKRRAENFITVVASEADILYFHGTVYSMFNTVFEDPHYHCQSLSPNVLDSRLLTLRFSTLGRKLRGTIFHQLVNIKNSERRLEVKQ